MERDYGAELDEMKQQMEGIQALLQNLLPQLQSTVQHVIPEAESVMEKMMPDVQAVMEKIAPNLPDCAKGGPHPTVGHVEKMVGMHPDPHCSALLDQLENKCGKSGCSGRIAYLGVFASGGRQSTWIRSDVNADDLLPLIENRTAEKVLACIGSSDKLNMLLAILRQPRTVADLVSDCGFTSTGQVYHHLKPLQNADLIIQDQRGRYIVQPHRVQGLVMLLAGISDLVDPTYTQGNFAD